MQADNIGFGEKVLAAVGDFESSRFRSTGRTFAPPANHPRAKGFANRSNDAADLAVRVDTDGLAADANAECRLPLAFSEPSHLARQTAQRRQDQSPCEFRCGVGITRAARGHYNPLLRTRLQIDMRRRPSGLTDQFELRQFLDQFAWEVGTLLRQHD